MDLSNRTMVEPGNETTPATIRAQTYVDLIDEEKIRESVDIKEANIYLQGLPQDIYILVNHNEDAKQIWDRVKLLIQDSELSLQERESKLYDDFDTFTSIPGETIHSYYMRFAQLINDMHMIGMTMKPLQVNTKFVNHLQPKWSKFVTDVKLAKDMHTTNFDHLYAHLRQHEAHTNEFCLARQRYPDQIALVANSPTFVTPSPAVHQQQYQALVLQQSYQEPAIQQSSSTELDSGLVILSFNPSDDPIANLNKLMAFVTTAFSPRFPQINNQPRTSSNPRNQATIQDGRVTVQTVQGRQTQGYANNRARNTATNQGVNRQGAASQARVVKCYNCQEEGHFARQCTKPKRPKNSTWFKEKMLLSEALESGAYLDSKQLAFLADNGDTVVPAQASQEIPTPVAFQTDDLDAFDSNYDEVPSAKAILMANLSSYDSDVLSEIIVDKNAKVADFEKQIHSLKLQLNATVESHKTLSKTVECLKKESKQKKDKYLDEVIDLQKKNKALDNVVYKMGQSTQTMHMLTKPQAFYDETHKTALGYQNPFYLSQPRRKVPALYDGNTLVKTYVPLSETDSEETLELAEESRLKMLAKQNDPSLKENKVNIASVDYVALNKLSKHFVKHFVPQKKIICRTGILVTYFKPVSENPPVSSKPVLKKESPRGLPLINKKYFEIEKNELSLDNDRILEHIICQDVMNIVMHANAQTDNVLHANNNSLEHDNSALELLKHENDRLMKLLISQDLVHAIVNSLAAINDYKSMQQSFVDEYNETLVLKAELAKKNVMIEKAIYNELSKRYAPEFKEFFIINELQAQLKAKNVSIEKLKEHIANIKGKNVVESVQNVHNFNVVTSRVYKLDLPPLSPCIKNNMAAHVDYLKHTQENAYILHEIIKHARDLRPLDSDLASAYKFVTRIQELLVYVSATCPSLKHVSDKLVVVTLMSSARKVRFAKSNDTSKDKTQKQVQPQEKQTTNNSMSPSTGVSSSTKASGSKPRSNTKKDRISDYLNDVNARVKSMFVKSRPAKSKKKEMWKPTGHTNRTLIAKIMGYGDYQLGNVTILRVYYVEGLGHNLFYVGKSKKSFHKPKADDTNQEKLYLLHMDLCGPMRMESINRKKYILVIVDDYSRFTWVKFLRSKDESPEVIIKCLKQKQVCLNATVWNVRTNNRTEFVNHTLRKYYESVRISHQTSVARTPQQNGVVKRQNRTLVEAARTMLIFLKLHCFCGQKQSIQLVIPKTDPSYVSVTTKLHMS
ncbi:retrovirus-related pol polyprotein from transposon TNT 1-94 [Tanacetum coccineum]